MTAGTSRLTGAAMRRLMSEMQKITVKSKSKAVL